MLITCEDCGTNFNLNEGLLKNTGSRVQCSRCSAVFTAYPPGAGLDFPEKPSQEIAQESPAYDEDPTKTAQIDRMNLSEKPGGVDAETQTVPGHTDDKDETDLNLDNLLPDLEQDLEPDLEPDSRRHSETAIPPEITDEHLLGGDVADLDLDDLELDDLLLDSERDSELEPDSETATPPEVTDHQLTAADVTELDLDDLLPDLERDLKRDLESVKGEGSRPDGQDGPPSDQTLIEPDDLFEKRTASSGDKPPSTTAEDVFDMDLEGLMAEIDTQDILPAALQDSAENTEELDTLDLSDLTEMLKTDETSFGEEDLVHAPDDQDFVLDLNIEPEDGEGTGAVSDGQAGPEDEEIEVIDLEALFGGQTTGEAQAASKPDTDDIDLNLDLMLEEEIETDGIKVSDLEEMLHIETKMDDLEAPEPDMDDIDLDLDLMLDGDRLVKDDSSPDRKAALVDYDLPDINDIDLKKDQGRSKSALQDSRPGHERDPAHASDDQSIPQDTAFAERGAESESSFSISDQESSSDQDTLPGTKVYQNAYSTDAKKRVRPFILIVFIIALLVGGSYGVMSILKKSGGKIPSLKDLKLPFIGKITPSETVDADNLKMSPYEINSKFMKNSQSGRLFVITGKVRNDSSQTRGAIKLKGNLYAEGPTLIKSETIYCGNTISDANMAKMNMAQIRKKLANRIADNKQKIQAVAPGQSIPFMVVFSDLPDNLHEYIIEVTDSTIL